MGDILPAAPRRFTENLYLQQLAEFATMFRDARTIPQTPLQMRLYRGFLACFGPGLQPQLPEQIALRMAAADLLQALQRRR